MSCEPAQDGTAPDGHDALHGPQADLSAFNMPGLPAVESGQVRGGSAPLQGVDDSKPAGFCPAIAPELLDKIALSKFLCFDIDNTLNWERGKPISEEAAELIFQFILIGKQVSFISGRTFDDFRTIDTLQPLLRRLKERNIGCDLTVYSAEGGEKVTVRNDGSFEHDPRFTVRIPGSISRALISAIRQADGQLDREHDLRRRGIRRYLVNYRGLRISWSPYGNEKRDEGQYDFEKMPNGGRNLHPPKKTREELGREILLVLRAQGITGLEALVSGKTTLSFTSAGVNKRRAMLDVLRDGSAVYFGDEVSRCADKIGNDRIIGEMASKHSGTLTVVALDPPGGDLPRGVYRIGGLHDGTLHVLQQAYRLCQARAEEADQKLHIARHVLKGYDLGEIIRLTPLHGGHGTHQRFFLVDTALGKYVLRHVRPDFFHDTLSAARHEVWVVNTLNECGVPFAPIVPRTASAELPPCKEDQYISQGPDGICHLLYRFVEGEVGSHANMNQARFDEMLGVLTKMHQVLAGQPCPYARDFKERSILAIARNRGEIRKLKAKIKAKKECNPTYVYTRAERLVVENGDFIERQLRLCVKNLKGVYQRLPKLTVHADYHPPNAVFNGDKVVGVFDLERMRVEARIYDLVSMFRTDNKKGRFDLESARRLIFAYHQHNRLTPGEIRALPEIFRLKLLDRACRLVYPDQHFESLGFNFTAVPEEERSLAMIDRDDKLFRRYQDLIMALRDLDARVQYGDFRRQIQEPLKENRMTAGEVMEKCRRNLHFQQPGCEIAICDLKQFSLADMLENGRPIESVFEEDKGRWSKEGNYYINARDPQKGWCKLKLGEKVLFHSDKVVACEAPTGNIEVWIRGDDLEKVRRNADLAHIVILLDENRCAKAVHMVRASDRDLSRSSIAIQLTDSGIFDRFPTFQALLKYQLVWQDVNGGLRHRELLDSYDIRIDLLNAAMTCPEEVRGEEISNILHFRYFKTRVVRRKALEALAELYNKGRIRHADYSFYVARFIKQDIAEDFRIIERSIKNDPAFVSSLFCNLFGEENVTIADIASVSLGYLAQGPAQEIYLAVFTMKDGSQRKAAMSLMRHDTLNEEYGVSEDDIKESILRWKLMCQHRVPGMVKYGGHSWEIDYRDKDIILGGEGERVIKEKLVNNIVVTCREFVPGESLADLLKREDISDERKTAAIQACHDLCALVFRDTENKLGRGYFMYPPAPRKFILEERHGEFTATMTDVYRIVDYPSPEALLTCFEKFLAAG